MLASRDVISNVHQGNRVVEMLFGAFELIARSAVEVLVAGIEMNAGTVSQFSIRAADEFLEVRLRLLKLVLLHGAQTDFIALDGLGILRIVRRRLLRGRFLGHVQNSSCGLRNRYSLRARFGVACKVSPKWRVEGNAGRRVPCPSSEQRACASCQMSRTTFGADYRVCLPLGNSQLGANSWPRPLRGL